MMLRTELRNERSFGSCFSGWVLALLPLGVMGVILLVRPGYFEPLLITQTGRILLLFSGMLLTIGLLAVRTISRLEG